MFFEGLKESDTTQLLSRWKQNSKYIFSRKIVSPHVDFNRYLSMLKTIDIVLDPFYFGMGNTFYQSMALEIPVVTMPSEQGRGRVVYALYKQMGINNPPVANSPEEYISICKKLAFNNRYKEDIKNQIATSKSNLFNDQDIHKYYIEFFQKAIEAARKNELLPFKWRPGMESLL